MKVLAVSGSSGGHIFPSLSLLFTLKIRNSDVDTLLVLPKTNLVNQIFPDSLAVRYISISSVKLNLDFKNFVAMFKFLKGVLESMFILFEFRPDVVVGFGSLVSIPIIFFAWIFRIKTLIHEQNVIPGRANRLLSKITDRIAISFVETKKYFSNGSNKILLTGNPLRRDFKRIDKMKALGFFGFTPDKITILVMGGSSGSHSINMKFLYAITQMLNKSKLQIIHLSGTTDYDFLKSSYKALDVNIRLFSFLNEMSYAYSASDLVVSRGGATTVTEIIYFRLPAIIIPYPFAYEHQHSNARVLERYGCAKIINDKESEGDTLKQVIIDFIDNPDIIKEISLNYNKVETPGASANDLLSDAVLSLAKS